ncbi:aminopeptidase P family protein [Oceanicella actignis]|uniref:Xaa-Pro aminopeptidase n=1 Tax=Oceanicella actignis TaxID=1189325 RepID=A0A1M7SAL9_9RHOB|nr:aminopeptidase P family protein [Oceanicella actignis]SET28907.1 Xaa-Pro aminopeptidase [Oceanicella actignis]SHN55560.1 Xaa-Pro aminopeptidase [Oceanicella actignis]
MFQSFDDSADPSQGPARLAALRARMKAAGLDGFLIPRADAHMGEQVAPRDERLAWLTGFTGSAGLCVALETRAALFVDGRYDIQARAQTDPASFEIRRIETERPEAWLREALPEGGRLGYDPWLHPRDELDRLTRAVRARGGEMAPVENLVDAIWTDRPPAPSAPAFIHPERLAGESAASKRARLGAELAAEGLDAAALTLPDSICWLLNIRGADVPRTPVVQAFALLHADGRAQLFADPAKFDAQLRAHLGPDVSLARAEDFGPALDAMKGRKVAVDRASAPAAVSERLSAAGAEIVWRRDPCILPKAVKNAAELAGARAAHRMDGAALSRFLRWLAAEAPGGALTEIDVVVQLERMRAETGRLHDISFDTICGAGPHGAIVHYRVTRATNRAVRPGDVLLIDSGGQYPEGTTDVTRTVAVGAAPEAARRAFTLALKGMIAVSCARWPKGLTGRDLDPLARAALWRAGLDYDHGTGHGVGAFLSVHEGPQRLSRRTDEPLLPGMILSNEPGVYREGAWGIRIENLLAVAPAQIPEGGEREMLSFETLTLAPIDRAMIAPDLLAPDERAWLDAYHARVLAEIGPLLEDEDAAWLAEACAPL